ncbi:hypothetical protein DQ04_02581090, partial [Trypanosoma grayi]|uniref:hypothetical protein n=1 Tax=Trypanosoma grayi TaxID=71804 RepID=UPI0004F485A7
MTELVVYENHDVFLEHPTRTRIPLELSTLEKFLSFVSASIAASYGDATAAGRYRFVYSVTGKPLWRVTDCREAGKVVVSCTPGFLQRKHGPRVQPEKERTSAHRQAAGAATTTAAAAASAVSVATPPRRASLPCGGCSSGGFSPLRGSTESDSIRGSGVSCGGSDAEPSRVAVAVDGRRVVLLPTPRFTDPALGAGTEVPHLERLAAVQTLISLKLIGRPFLESELLFRTELEARLRPIIFGPAIKYEKSPTRIVIEGPPKSGVSTALAYCSYLATSAPGGKFSGCLFLPLNFELLFDDVWIQSIDGERPDSSSTVGGGDARRHETTLLDVPFFFTTVVRWVVDCAVAQRPALRDGSDVLIEAWEKLVTDHHNNSSSSSSTPVRFGGSQLARLVGHRTLYQWEAFAAAAIHVLRAVVASPHDVQLRDAFIETVLVAFVAQMASSLHFSGVLYVVDGLRCISTVLQHRVQRPAGDAGVFLRCVMQKKWAHVIAGVDTLALSPCSMLFPAHVHRVGLLHLLSPAVLTTGYGFPGAIQCGGKRFPLQLLLGAPGYLQALHAL